MDVKLSLSKADRINIAGLILQNASFTDALTSISLYFLKKDDTVKAFLFTNTAVNISTSLLCCNLTAKPVQLAAQARGLQSKIELKSANA